MNYLELDLDGEPTRLAWPGVWPPPESVLVLLSARSGEARAVHDDAATRDKVRLANASGGELDEFVYLRCSFAEGAPGRAVGARYRLATGDEFQAWAEPERCPECGRPGYRSRKRPGPIRPSRRHGTLLGYSSDECRCGACRSAMAKYQRERRAQRKP